MGRAKRTNKEWWGIQKLATVESQHQPKACQAVKTMLQMYSMMYTACRELERGRGNLQQVQSRRGTQPCQTMSRKLEDEDKHNASSPLLWFPAGPPHWSNTTRRQKEGKRCQENQCVETSTSTLLPFPHPTHSKEQSRIMQGRNGSRGQLITTRMVDLKY